MINRLTEEYSCYYNWKDLHFILNSLYNLILHFLFFDGGITPYFLALERRAALRPCETMRRFFITQVFYIIFLYRSGIFFTTH